MNNSRRYVLVSFYFILLYQVIDSDRPQFEQLMKDGSIVAEDHEILLPCTALGTPRPSVITWLFNDKPVKFSRWFLRRTGSLRIPRAKREDAGHFQCVARNLDGGVVSEKRQLIVAYFDKLPRPSPEVITKKMNQYIEIQPPVFSCEPPPKYIWKKDNVVIKESSKIKVTANGTLFISNLDDLNQGRYELTLENTFLADLGDRGPGVTKTRQKAKIVELKIYQSDWSNTLSIIYYSPRLIAGEGKTKKVTLECFVNGEPTGRRVSVEWFKKDYNDVSQPIASSAKYRRLDENRRLEINNPTYRYDNGKFACVTYADNEMKDEEIVYLDVFEPPRVLLKPQDTVGYTDNYTMINCTTKGSPYWTNRWYRNGIPVVPDGDKVVVHPNNTLSLRSLNWEDDGFFQCAAENYAQLSFFPVQVEVKNISARIVNYFADVYAGRDAIVEVPCVAVGAPKPTISWTFNYSLITFPSSKYSLASNGSLIIKGMTEAQNGYYVCSANNYIQMAQREAKVWLVVVTRFVDIPKETTYARRGENKVLPCTIEHDPNINYTREWRYNDLPVSNPRYYVQRDGGLLIRHAQEVDDGREFSCHIFSFGGNLTCKTILNIVQLPLQPSSPRATDIQAYSMRLTWDAPSDGGSAITGYKLFMRNETQNFYLLVELPAVTTYLLNNLMAGSKHKFQVSARNKFGEGVRSYPSKYWIETKSLAPSEAPSDIRTIDRGTDYITLAWKIPPRDTHNGELEGFYISYRLAGYKSDEMDFTNVYMDGGERTTYRMDNLPLFTEYEIRLAAYNKAGVGVWSSIHTVETMQGKPTAPPTKVSVEAINDTAVYVNFTSPPQKQWHGKLEYIVAKTWPPGRPQDSTEYRTEYDHSSLHDQTFILKELTADRVYILSVAVATNGGASPGSDWVMFRTREGVPDAVRDLQVSGIYSDAFTVSWRVPKKPAGQLKGYKIMWRYANLDRVRTWRKFDEGPYATGAVISPLQPRTRYEVQVAAFTGKGVGTYEAAAVTTIEKPELPDAPTDLKAYVIWGTNISMGFTPGYSGRAVINYYLIEYNNDTAYHKSPKPPVWRLIRNLTKILENPVNITGLIPNTKYRFRMRAFNVMGASPYSNVSADIQTSDGIPSKPPTNIRVAALERETLSIRWTAPAADTWNSGSIKYEFLIKPKGENPRPGEKEPIPTIKLLDTQATQYVAHGLQKFRMYNITIRLYNDKGVGPWSKPVFASTSEDYPEKAPCCVEVLRYGTDFVTLGWGEVPEKYRNGVILGYKIYYEIKNVKDTILWQDFPGAKTFKGTINGLAGYRDYKFQLLAYTKVGGTVKGTPIIQKTKQGKPGPPRDIRFFPIRYDYTTVRWNSPTNPNGDIIGYEVKYRKKMDGGRWVTHTDELQRQQMEAKVRGLVYNEWYIFNIRAQTAMGWGEPAEATLLVTNERSTPDSPVILAIPRTSVQTKSIMLKWKSRYDGRAPIRSYNIQYNEEFTGWQPYRFGIPPTDDVMGHLTQLEITRLKPGTKYEFRIRATNDVGSSVWSRKSKPIQTNREAQMGAPVDGRVTQKTKTTLLVEWERPLIVGVSGNLRGYKVKHREVAGIQDFKYESVNAGTTELMLSNLRVFTAYEVAIGAFNDKDHGAWSPLYRWRTGEDLPLYAPSYVKCERQGSNSYMRCTWIPPSDESINGYNLGFKVETRRESFTRKRRSLYRVCHSPPAVETHLVHPGDTEITLKNLLKYTRYSVTVRVYNHFADGPKSRKVYFDTPRDVPGPPYILSTRTYINQVEVDFERPCRPNGRIMEYKAVLEDAAGRHIETKSPNPERVRFTGLLADTRYILKLSARTDQAGWGQKVTIDFNTFKNELPGPPGPPGAPEIYNNTHGLLMLQWEPGDAKNVPVQKFYLEYKTTTTGWQSYRTIVADEMRYNDGKVLYQIVGLTVGKTYRFRVKSKTKYGLSPFSESSKPIKAMADPWDTPVYKEIWFIFVLVILFLILLIIGGVCCYRFKHGKGYTKAPAADGKSYRFSNFEQAMIESTGDQGSERPLLPPSRNVSTHASQHSRKSVNDDSASIVKSIKSSVVDDDDDTEEETRRVNRKVDEEESIANHYSNNPTHKTWQNSLDQDTKTQVLDQFKNSDDERRRPLPPPVRPDDQQRQNRRPGKRDTTLQKQLARSNPELNDTSSKYASISKPQPQPRPQTRPMKKPIDKVLTRSQPDLNRELGIGNGTPSRAPSFLRARDAGSGGGGSNADDGSDNESFQDVLAKEKTKRELARDMETTRYPPPNPYAPPPYDYHAAPPAYTPSESDDGDKTFYDNVKPRFHPPPPIKRDGYPKYASRHSMPPQPVEHDDDDMDDTGDMTYV